MKGKKCIVSLDTVVIIGSLEHEEKFYCAVRKYQSSNPSKRFNLSAYGVNVYAPDGTRISADFNGYDPKRVRIEINPSKADFFQLSFLLSCLRDIRLQRLDVALDFIGYEIQDYEFHCTRLGYANHRLSRKAFPHSYAFGEGASHRRIAVYDRMEKCRVDRVDDVRIIDLDGVVHVIPVWNLRLNDVGWFRVELRLKGNWLVDSLEPKHTALDDFIAKQRIASSLDLSIHCEAMMEYLSNHPAEIRRLNRNTQTKYRKLLRKAQVENGLNPDPTEVYRDNYFMICDAIKRILTLGSQKGDESDE